MKLRPSACGMLALMPPSAHACVSAATPSVHTVVSGSQSLRNPTTPSVHTLVAGSRFSAAGAWAAPSQAHTCRVGVNTTQAAASSNEAPPLTDCVEAQAEYLPDIAPYPCYGALKKEFTPDQLSIGQADRCARCPTCKLDIVALPELMLGRNSGQNGMSHA